MTLGYPTSGTILVWFWVERSNVKVTVSQSAKHIEDDRVAGVSYVFFRVPSLYTVFRRKHPLTYVLIITGINFLVDFYTFYTNGNSNEYILHYNLHI